MKMCEVKQKSIYLCSYLAFGCSLFLIYQRAWLHGSESAFSGQLSRGRNPWTLLKLGQFASASLFMWECFSLMRVFTIPTFPQGTPSVCESYLTN